MSAVTKLSRLVERASRLPPTPKVVSLEADRSEKVLTSWPDEVRGDSPRKQAPELEQPLPSSTVPVDTLSSAIRQAERNAERQQRQGELEAQSSARLAEREARSAEQQAQREQQKAQRTAIQRQREVERQATAAEEATRRANQESERRVAAAKRQAIAAAEAKQRECTASFMARARCAAQGYNPLTGTKN